MGTNRPIYPDIKDKVAIVTGGALGIGEATVRELCRQGAYVGILDIHTENGSKLEKELNDKYGPKSKFFHCDVSNKNQVEEAINKITKEFGPPFFLVNNAGIEYNDDGNLITMSEEKTRKILEVNLMGQINMLRAVIPLMVENGGGRIVNISSVQALRSDYPGTIYQATKSGILTLARDVVNHYSRDNIKANTVLPGAIKTKGMGNMRGSDFIDKVREAIPLGRRGHAYEVANLILFLLSEQSSYINGAEIIIDGGITCGFNLKNLGSKGFPVSGDPDA